MVMMSVCVLCFCVNPADADPYGFPYEESDEPTDQQ
jgi:hypothetical protein